MHNPLDKMVEGTLDIIKRTNGQKPIATQSQYAQALLQKIPGQVMPLASPNSDMFGGRFTYHRYSDPKDQEKIKGFETAIGSLKNTMPLVAGGALLTGQLLSPIRKLLRGVPGSFLLNPLILAGGATAVSAFLAVQKKEQMNNYLSGRMKNIQGGVGDFERDLSAMSMNTMDQHTGIRQAFSAVNRNEIETMLERMDDVARDRNGLISDVPARMYSLQDGTHLYARTKNADLYSHVTLPQNAEDDNITLEQMTYVRNNGKMTGRLISAPKDPVRRKAMFMRELIQKSGLGAHKASSDVAFIFKNKKLYTHALNLFKAKHSAVNTILESVNKDIRNASNAIRQELSRRPMSPATIQSIYKNSVIRKIKNEVSPSFSKHHDMLNIVDSLLHKEWCDLMADYKNRMD